MCIRDSYKYYPNRVSLVGESSGQAFSLGDQIRVKIASVEPAQGKIDLIVENSIQKKAKMKKRLSKKHLAWGDKKINQHRRYLILIIPNRKL